MPERRRRITVLNYSRNGGAKVPAIHMVGKYLARAGFAPGSRLEVTVEPCRLTVIVLSRPRPLPPRREDA